MISMDAVSSPYLTRAVYNLWVASCHALVPSRRQGPPSQEEIKLYGTYIRHRHKCVYCGDCATAMDHFRAFMKPKGLPSGFCNDMWNMVPSCTTCNSSKGNRNWRAFMTRRDGKAPLARGVPASTHRRRILRLEAFEKVGNKYVQRWKPMVLKTRLQALRLAMIKTLRRHAFGISRLRKSYLKTQNV